MKTDPEGVEETAEGTRRVTQAGNPFLGLDRIYAVHDGVRRGGPLVVRIVVEDDVGGAVFWGQAELTTYYVWRATPKCVIVSTTKPFNPDPSPGGWAHRIMATPSLVRLDSKTFDATPEGAQAKALRKRRYHVKMAERRAAEARARLVAIEALET